MKRSLLIAALITLGAIGWIASGQLGQGNATAERQKPAAEVALPGALTAVRVALLAAEPHAREILLRGWTEARRMVDLKVEAAGRVAEILVPEGTSVEAGTLLLRVAENDLAARLKEAEALLAQRQIEHAAAAKLAEKGYRSETELAGALAALQAAEAMVEAARIHLENTRLLAPFAGTVERHLVKEGGYAELGDPVVRLVELDPLLVVAHANEEEVLRLAKGATAEARLADGRSFAGEIVFVASAGEAATRSFRIELALDNKAAKLPVGITADIAIALPPEPAYKVSPAVLVLDDQGRIGVKAVDQSDRVVFHPATIIDDAVDGIWLGGLPPRLRLIVVGQEFVKVGETVLPVDAATLAERKGSGG